MVVIILSLEMARTISCQLGSSYRILVYKDEFFNSYKKNQVTATCFECHVINGRTPLLDDIIRGFNNYPKEGKLASDFQQIIINYIR